MSWVTASWSMIVSACLTIAGLQLMIWVRQRQSVEILLLAVSAIALSCLAACELWMMRSLSTAQYSLALRLAHVPVWVLFVCLVGFIRIHLQAGRQWLAWAAIGTRTLSLAANFLAAPNLNYVEITSIRQVIFLGEPVSIAEGIPNPWMLLGQTSLLLFVAFALDATRTVWKRGSRQLALMLGGSISLFVGLSALQTALKVWGGMATPFTISWFYMGIVLAVGYGLSRDVLHGAKLAGELRESEQQLTLASETAHLGFWFQDIAGRKIRATHIWRRLFGYSQTDALGIEGMLERLHPDDREHVREAFSRAAGAGIASSLEFRVVPPVGNVRWLAARVGVSTLVEGKAGRIFCLVVEVTARRQSEAEASRQRGELAHLSRVAMMGELSGSLAHELTQPLTAIHFNAQAALALLTQGTENNDEVREILCDILQSDELAIDVIGRLRAMIKNEKVLYCPLKMDEVVLDVLKLMRSDLSIRNVAVKTDLAAALPLVEGDRVQLQQVLLNLIANGCDAMDVRSPAERVLTIRAATDEAGAVEVSVCDRGHGIPAESPDRIFEPFISTKPKGMGLGLAVCRTIVSAHKGQLRAENNADCGATFRFTLPGAN